MSFADLEAGEATLLPRRRQEQQRRQEPSQAAAAGIFQINTAVTAYRRLVNTLGTHKDTLDFRDRLHKTRIQTGELVKETSAKLREASETDMRFEVSASKKIADAKLAKEFQAVLKEFHRAQRLAAERETTYSPFVPKEVPSSSGYDEDEEEASVFQRKEQEALLLESRRQEVLKNELVYNEAIIEEREQGIQEVQRQIDEVNEIFKDLANVVRSDWILIVNISSNIENSHAATTQGTSQVARAAKAQKSSSSLVCLLLVIFGIVLLIVIIVVIF